MSKANLDENERAREAQAFQEARALSFQKSMNDINTIEKEGNETRDETLNRLTEEAENAKRLGTTLMEINGNRKGTTTRRQLLDRRLKKHIQNIMDEYDLSKHSLGVNYFKDPITGRYASNKEVRRALNATRIPSTKTPAQLAVEAAKKRAAAQTGATTSSTTPAASASKPSSSSSTSSSSAAASTAPINASSVNSVVVYLEPQLNRLCAKHALNNLLQEEKICYMKNGAEFYDKRTNSPAPGANIMEKHIQLNFFYVCDELAAQALGITGMLTDPACEATQSGDQDNMTFDNVEILVKKLGYGVISERAYMARLNLLTRKPIRNSSGHEILDPNPGFYTNVEAQLNDPNVIGMLINLGGWHYTAVTKFARGCSIWQKNTTGRLSSTNKTYLYLDSFPAPGHYNCFSMSDLIKHLKTLGINSVLYVYDQPGAYKSVATFRQRMLLGKPVGPRKSRKNRSNRKNRRNTRRH